MIQECLLPHVLFSMKPGLGENQVHRNRTNFAANTRRMLYSKLGILRTAQTSAKTSSLTKIIHS